MQTVDYDSAGDSHEDEYFPYNCTLMQLDMQPADNVQLLEYAAGGLMACGVLWHLPQYEILRVYIMNPDQLSSVNLCKQKFIKLANRWNPTRCATVPRFELESNSSKANIRVSIQVDGKNSETVLGCRALDADVSKPTMKLGLQRCSKHYNQHIIVHEFGHALGLQHEHQRSCFLSTAKKYLDENKIKGHLRTYSEERFKRDWWEPVQGIESPKCSYDDESVMHYWFCLEWLKDEYQKYSDLNEVEQLPDGDDKCVLRGIHKRQMKHGYIQSPSPTDLKYLEDCYGSGTTGPMGITHILNQIIIAIKGVADGLKATESSERLLQISSDLQHFVVKVGFIGLTNSGKSTTLNALLGQNFLPTAEQRETVCPVHIQHDSSQNHPGILYGRSKTNNRLAKLESGSQSIRSKIKELNKKAHKVGETGYAELVLRAPILCLAGKEMTKYEIYDTPGVSERKESVATTQANHALKGTAAVVLVISPDSADFENLTDFTDQIKQAHPSMMEEQSRIVVLINKHDKCYLVDEIVETYTWDPDTLKQNIGEQIAVPPEQIICFSALFALKARMLKQDPSAYKKSTYKTLHAKLSKTPEGNDIDSLKKCLAKPEKLIDACEKFSNVVAVEKVLCEKLFSNEQVLLKSSVDDSCCEIDKIKAAIVEKIEGLEIEMNKLEYLIKQINEFLNDCCRNSIFSSLDNTLQNCKEILKEKALNLESEINSKASEKVASDSSLQGQYGKIEDLRDRIKNKRSELQRFTEASIKELWNSGIQEMKRKLTMELETVLSKLKKDLVATHFSGHFNFESVDPVQLLKSCSFPLVIQPALDQFADISDAAMDTLVLRRTVTKQRNETKEGRVSTGRKFLIAGPRTHKTYHYNVVADYEATEYEVDRGGFTETFKQLAKGSANFVYKNLETVLNEQTSELSQMFLNKLQQISKQPLKALNDELEKKVKDCQELDEQTKFLDTKRKELTSVLSQMHSQPSLLQGSTPSSNTSELLDLDTKDTSRKREHPTDSQGSPPPTEPKKPRHGD